MTSEVVSRHDFVNPGEEFGLGHAAGFLRNDGSVAVHEERWDATDAQLRSGSGVLFGIDLGDEDFSLLCNGLKDRSDGFARGTPWGPEVDDDPFAVVDGIVEFAVVDISHFAHVFT